MLTVRTLIRELLQVPNQDAQVHIMFPAETPAGVDGPPVNVIIQEEGDGSCTISIEEME